MKLRALFRCWLGLMSLMPLSHAKETPETVILLHGLGRTRYSMSLLANSLRRAGYQVENLSYPSRTKSLESLAGEWLPAQVARHQGSRLHFVTHSMGGIIVRLWLRDHPAPSNLGRVVMLAPPNQGSEISDRLNAFAPFRWATGPNGRRLGTADDALPRALGAWPAAASDLGVIAGDRSLNPLFSLWLPGADDGKVTIASTHQSGERDHLTLHASHTWLPAQRSTAEQVLAFLRTGQFLRSSASDGRKSAFERLEQWHGRLAHGRREAPPNHGLDAHATPKSTGGTPVSPSVCSASHKS